MDTQKKLIVLIGVVLVIAVALLAVTAMQSEENAAAARGANAGNGNGAERETLVAAFDAEFHTRPDGYKGLTAHYGFSFPQTPKQMDPGLMYQSCANGSVDIIDAFATDGRIAAYELYVLEDDRNFFPPYYAAPLVRQETLKKHPALKETLNLLAGTISDGKMQTLNYQVDEKGKKARDVALAFLVQEGVLGKDARPGTGEGGSVSIGGKQFTEQEILGELMALLVEYKTDLSVERNLNLGGTMICFNALKAGDLDLYVEYTGTGYVSILDNEKAVSDPEKTFKAVKSAFAEKWSLQWLEPLGFNNTYTLTMRGKQAERLGIGSISDLADYLNGKGLR
jgi:osmoprotectant transport system permease protein